MSSWLSMTPNLMTDDMAKSVQFYTEVLGFELAMNVPEQAPYVWCQLVRDKVTVMLQTRESIAEEHPIFAERPGGGALGLYTKIEDVEGLYAQIKDKAEIIKEPNTTFYGAREFTITDPDGFLITFAQFPEEEA